MSKKMVGRAEKFDFSDWDGLTLEEIIERLQVLNSAYPDGSLDIIYDYGNTEYSIQYKSIETDIEYKMRSNKESRAADKRFKANMAKELKEQQEYERLKEKYG